MADSWRNILERAAANLSIDLDKKASAGLGRQPAGWPGQGRPASQPRTFVESRNLLARELDAISGQTPKERPGGPQMPARRAKNPGGAQRPPMTQAVRPPAPDLQPKPAQTPKSSSGRALAALAVSVAIVVLTVYAIFGLLH
ncbi:MAG: hypothetical protein ACLPWS_22850 [Rhodomicrobium sp.]